MSSWQTMVEDHHEAMRAVVGPRVATAAVVVPQPADVDVGGDAEVVEVAEAKGMHATNKVARATTARHGHGDRRPRAKTAKK